MGYSQANALTKEPVLRLLYEQYLICRNVDMKSLEKPVAGKTDGSKKLVIYKWTTGFNFLPRPGGIDQQSYYDLRMFQAFLQGDREGAENLLER